MSYGAGKHKPREMQLFFTKINIFTDKTVKRPKIQHLNFVNSFFKSNFVASDTL